MDQLPDDYRRAIEAAQERAVSAQDDESKAAAFPNDIAAETVDVLADLEVIAPPTTPAGPVPIERLVNEMAAIEYSEGFTFSPTLDETRSFTTPEDGHHCVALPGTDLPVTWAVTSERDEEADRIPANEARLFRDWVEFMAPVFSTGKAWIGGYRPESGDSEAFRTEVSLVFLPEHRRQATESAEAWQQESMWTVIKDHPDRGVLTVFGHEPCKSVFLALRRLRNARSRRRRPFRRSAI